MRGSIIKHTNKDGTITYYIKYGSPSGKQIKKAIGPKKKDAEKALSEVIKQINAGEYTEMPDIKFEELAEKWLEIKKNNLRPTTLTTYEAAIKHANKHFNNINVRKITPYLCDEFAANLSKQDFAPATIIKNLTVLKSIFKKAIQWRYINRNPAESVERPKLTKKEINFYSIEEINLLLENTNEFYRTLIKTLALSGLRVSEALGLRWDDIDFVGGKIYVRHTLYKGELNEPKTDKSKRVVVIPIKRVSNLSSLTLLPGNTFVGARGFEPLAPSASRKCSPPELSALACLEATTGVEPVYMVLQTIA